MGLMTDLWAVGATLFHAFAGRPPFVAESRLKLLELLSQGQAPALAQVTDAVPPQVAAVVDRALATSPSDRFQSARQLQSALHTVAARRPETNPAPTQVRSGPLPSSSSVVPTSPNNESLVGWIGGSAAVGLVLLGVRYRQSQLHDDVVRAP